jgi:hypothetical protein
MPNVRVFRAPFLSLTHPVDLQRLVGFKAFWGGQGTVRRRGRFCQKNVRNSDTFQHGPIALLFQALKSARYSEHHSELRTLFLYV